MRIRTITLFLLGLTFQSAIAFHYEVYELPPVSGHERSIAKRISEVDQNGIAYVIGTSIDNDSGVRRAVRWSVNSAGPTGSLTIAPTSGYDWTEGFAIAPTTGVAGGAESSVLTPGYISGFVFWPGFPRTDVIGPISGANQFYSTITFCVQDESNTTCGIGSDGSSPSTRISPARGFVANGNSTSYVFDRQLYPGTNAISDVDTCALDMNSDLHVVGYGGKLVADDDDAEVTQVAYYWGKYDTIGTPLGHLAGYPQSNQSQANGINIDQEIVGQSDGHAFMMYGPTPNTMSEILLDIEDYSTAMDVNDSGFIVGHMLDSGTNPYSPWFVWGGFDFGFDLNEFCDLPQGVLLLEANGINNSAWIAAEGLDSNNEKKGYLLVPVED